MPEHSFPDEPALLAASTVHWRAHRRWTWNFLGALPVDVLALTDAEASRPATPGWQPILFAARRRAAVGVALRFRLAVVQASSGHVGRL